MVPGFVPPHNRNGPDLAPTRSSPGPRYPFAELYNRDADLALTAIHLGRHTPPSLRYLEADSDESLREHPWGCRRPPNVSQERSRL